MALAPINTSDPMCMPRPAQMTAPLIPDRSPISIMECADNVRKTHGEESPSGLEFNLLYSLTCLWRRIIDPDRRLISGRPTNKTPDLISAPRSRASSCHSQFPGKCLESTIL